MDKFKFLDETMKLLGLSRQEVVDYWSNTQDKSEKSKPVLIDITKVEAGMFWYEDNTFSKERELGKKIKAIVELVENGIIYGDLTASELFDIKEEMLNWENAKAFIEKFSYPCQKNEKVVWYERKQLVKVYRTYKLVKEVFCKIGKPFRKGFYWSSTEYSSTKAWTLYFLSGGRWYDIKYSNNYVRPVLSLDTRCLV